MCKKFGKILKVQVHESVPPIAQLAEQLPLKEKVPGSRPGGRTLYKKYGRVAEWLKARLSKSRRGGNPLVSSNLTSSDLKFMRTQLIVLLTNRLLAF